MSDVVRGVGQEDLSQTNTPAGFANNVIVDQDMADFFR
jgi:hypothetical protein